MVAIIRTRYARQSSSKPINMIGQVLTTESSEYLVGKKIIEANNNYIVLDNGLRIHLEDDEILHLNYLND